MKYAKMLGLLAVAAAALMAFAGSASATVLTQGSNHEAVSVGTSIHAVNNGVVKLDGSLIVECSVSTVAGEVTSAGSASTTVSGHLSALTFEECGSRTVTVVSKGELEVHTHPSESSTYGTLTSSGATVTVLAHLPFNVTVHCSYTTHETTIGTITSSDHQIATGVAETAQIHASASIPLEAGSPFGCGSSPPTWTGTYDVTTPMHLDVD